MAKSPQFLVGDSVRDVTSDRVGVIEHCPLNGRTTLPYLVRFSDGRKPDTAYVKANSMVAVKSVMSSSFMAQSLGSEAKPLQEFTAGSLVCDVVSDRSGVIIEASTNKSLPYLVRFSDGKKPETGLVQRESAQLPKGRPVATVSPTKATLEKTQVGQIQSSRVAGGGSKADIKSKRAGALLKGLRSGEVSRLVDGLDKQAAVAEVSLVPVEALADVENCSLRAKVASLEQQVSELQIYQAKVSSLEAEISKLKVGSSANVPVLIQVGNDPSGQAARAMPRFASSANVPVAIQGGMGPSGQSMVSARSVPRFASSANVPVAIQGGNDPSGQSTLSSISVQRQQSVPPSMQRQQSVPVLPQQYSSATHTQSTGLAAPMQFPPLGAGLTAVPATAPSGSVAATAPVSVAQGASPLQQQALQQPRPPPKPGMAGLRETVADARQGLAPWALGAMKPVFSTTSPFLPSSGNYPSTGRV